MTFKILMPLIREISFRMTLFVGVWHLLNKTDSNSKYMRESSLSRLMVGNTSALITDWISDLWCMSHSFHVQSDCFVFRLLGLSLNEYIA